MFKPNLNMVIQQIVEKQSPKSNSPGHKVKIDTLQMCKDFNLGLPYEPEAELHQQALKILPKKFKNPKTNSRIIQENDFQVTSNKIILNNSSARQLPVVQNKQVTFKIDQNPPEVEIIK